MSKANRAAQFAPFEALKGLQEALREKEEKHSRVEKIELTEEREEELSLKIRKAEKGADVKITFYSKGHYYNLKGIVAEKNENLKYITIESTKIYFDDIYEIEGV